ncbi:MAG: NAD(P)-binding domain-containing protein [Chitinophagales bacterium]|nr:NAD(P)-binding domain-containing protein [Chitinophagales bacterium]
MKFAKNASIAIIGAGSSGIAACKNLRQCGFDNITIFEQSNRVGGNWVYTEDVKHSSVYETTHIITSKAHSSYEDFPMPDSYPDYPSHWLMAEYYDNYAIKFGVKEKVMFNTTVSSIDRNADGKWKVHYTTKEGDTSRQTFDVLIVSNGHHWNPRYPNYPGKFEGEFIHSHYFKNNKPFAGKRAMVIGAGNSGCDAAVEVCRVAKKTYISMRRGYHFIPKFVFGQPADVIANKFQWVPDFLLDTVYGFVLRLENGDITKWGLQRPDHGVRQSHPVSNSELLYYVRHGEITPKPDIEKFEGKTVHFKDGSKEELDVIIAATGFKVTFPFFDKNLVDYEDKEVRLYKRIFHPDYRNLMFVGLIQASGCFWKLADYQSKLLANYLAGNYHLPHDMNKKIDEEIALNRKWYTKSARHLIEVDYFKYSKEVIGLIPGNAPAWVS